ncbi:MAG: alpha/beta hydrolase [Nocardioidaceae bacterium]
MAVASHAQPFAADAGETGVLLSHGFTGSTASIRPWAQFLADQGLTVRLPRLPGHGTTWQALNRTRWPDWYAAVDRAFRELTDRCDRVVVGGLSMGGTLALRLAQEHGTAVSGVVLVNPLVQLSDPRLVALPVLRHVVPSLQAIGGDVKRPGADEHAYDRNPLHALHSVVALGRVVRTDLPRVTQPLLLFRSAVDHVVDPLSAKLVMQRVSSPDLSEHVLGDSYHVATLDNDAPAIFAESLKFVRRVAADRPESTGVR